MADTSMIVGVFEDYSTANGVVQDLTQAGIPRENIAVQSNFRTGAAGRSSQEEQHEGGISGFFHRLFGGDDEADDSGNYAEAVRRGHAVVSVTAPEGERERVFEIMNQRGAIDIDRRVEDFRRTGYKEYDPKAKPYSSEEVQRERAQYGAGEGRSIPVIEEDLQIGKRAVQRGGVRVYSRIVEKPVNETIELQEEHVRVERRPADRALNRGEADSIREQSIEVTEMAEEAVVQKRARVREEVVVNKETTRRKEQVRDTVRHTEVEVEQLKEGRGATAGYADDFRRDYESRYGNSGDPYETMQPAYEYGYTSANDPRYSGRKWSEVEPDLRSDYSRRNPNSTWERVKDAVRYGWDKVTGKARS